MLQAGDPSPEEAPDGADCAEGARRMDAAEGASSERGRLDAFEAGVAAIAARVEPAYRQADGWLEQTRAGLVELLRFCGERPDTARTLIIDSIAWGPEVLVRRSQLLEALAGALDRGCEQVEPAAAPPPETAASLVGAALCWVQTRLVAERGSFLELAPSLMSMIVHPYLGPQAAKRELERPLPDAGDQVGGCRSERHAATVHERSY